LRPVRSSVKFTPAATRTGRVRTFVSPVPSWPSSLAPQHQPRPVTSTAHVCIMPASSRASDASTSTRTGAARRAREPSPTWPRSLPPQQYAVPSAPTKQVCVPPGCSPLKGRSETVAAASAESPGATDTVEGGVLGVALTSDAGTPTSAARSTAAGGAAPLRGRESGAVALAPAVPVEDDAPALRCVGPA